VCEFPTETLIGSSSGGRRSSSECGKGGGGRGAKGGLHTRRISERSNSDGDERTKQGKIRGRGAKRGGKGGGGRGRGAERQKEADRGAKMLKTRKVGKETWRR
jgi:hypothetical protein